MLHLPYLNLENVLNFLEPLKEFVNLDNNLTDQLLSLQAKAVELGLLAQKFEDEGNAYYALTQTGVSDNLPIFFGCNV